VISPVDGTIVARGDILGDGRQTFVTVKGERLSLERLVNGGGDLIPVGALHGGSYVVIFLSPDGYHRIHMPLAGAIDRVRRIPGRCFPQNSDALRHIRRVYERNERAALLLSAEGGARYVLVLIGASLVGGIHIDDLSHAGRRGPLMKGQEIAHFSFGSTVVLLLPPELPLRGALREGQAVRMGDRLA
jgi:phosphatidylserine decarboxylase